MLTQPLSEEKKRRKINKEKSVDKVKRLTIRYLTKGVGLRKNIDFMLACLRIIYISIPIIV